MSKATTTIFRNFTQVEKHQPLNEILHEIKTGKYQSQIEKLRTHYQSGDAKKYSGQKKKLLAFTPSGKFLNGRKISFISEYTGYIILDIDKVGNNLMSIRLNAESNPHTYACFLSPSHDGLKILVKANSQLDHHVDAFTQIKDYYEQILGCNIDPSGKDVSRLCFFSYDPELYLNKSAKVFEVVTNYKCDSNFIKQDQAKIALKPNNSNDESTKKTLKNHQKNTNTQLNHTKNGQIVVKLIEQIQLKQVDITSVYDNWLKIGFALESEFGETGRNFFHMISVYNPNYQFDACNKQYDLCLQNNNSGISIKTLFFIAKEHGIEPTEYNSSNTTQSTNKFQITEDYLKEHFDLRYNTVSNRYEYKTKMEDEFQEINENNLYIQLRKNNISIGLNDLTSLLKSDMIDRYDPFVEYFNSLPAWDGITDHIQNLSNYLDIHERSRFDKHFKKWLVRAVKTAIDKKYYNKQAIVLVSNSQNSGKSTFCRFLCPPDLEKYIAENIGTDKDSLIALTENFIINLDELSTANKLEINAFKSMFSKDTIKTRLPYDRRTSNLMRRASFIGSTDRWEFLSDENGSVRWLCFDINQIDWSYSQETDINLVWAQAYSLLSDGKFEYDITREDTLENDNINRKYQITTPERNLIQKHFKPSTQEDGEFMTPTDIQEYIELQTTLRLKSITIGRELKFLGYARISKRLEVGPVYGYYVKKITQNKSF